MLNLTVISQAGQKTSVGIDEGKTVQDLKVAYCNIVAVPREAVRLLYCGVELKPETKLLTSFNIGRYDNWNIHAMSRVIEIATAPATSASIAQAPKKENKTEPIIDLTVNDIASSSFESSRRRKRSRPSITMVDLTVDDEPIPTSSSSSSAAVASSSSSNVAHSPEKRAARFRTGTDKDRDRIDRALSQRLYLLRQDDTSTDGSLSKKFSVLGSTGNVYEVKISRVPSCTCPDFLRGHVCKHIIFVIARVLRVSSSSPLLIQRALLQSELATMFSSGGRCLSSVKANP